MKPEELKEKLTKVVGQTVRLVNEADVDSVYDRLRIHVHGILEAPDDDEEWTVRVKSDAWGVSVIGFPISKVIDVYRQPSGTVAVTLK